ncbi:hypothetical protein QTP12_02290, partial [Klebsiella oxytoca]|nr:hypothetical protein [Klebsiella oxytoca]MDM4188066.1 hypothetical protein [Klebsiella oxytoca]MDM4196070.1 hypothetical protein [Klebsiella oxytoca]MDM4619350.1 hypothetical protein [Klebsiella oxytoca]
PVARARRVKRRPRDQSAPWLNFPEAMLRICPGYPTADGGEPWGLPARRRRNTCSPGKARQAPPPGPKCTVAEFPGGDAAHLSGLPNRRRR